MEFNQITMSGKIKMVDHKTEKYHKNFTSNMGTCSGLDIYDHLIQCFESPAHCKSIMF